MIRHTVTTLLLPNRATNQPEKGIDTNKPTGIDRRTTPSPDSDNRSDCWIVGIREAQDAKESPSKKNKPPTAIR